MLAATTQILIEPEALVATTFPEATIIVDTPPVKKKRRSYGSGTILSWGPGPSADSGAVLGANQGEGPKRPEPTIPSFIYAALYAAATAKPTDTLGAVVESALRVNKRLRILSMVLNQKF